MEKGWVWVLLAGVLVWVAAGEGGVGEGAVCPDGKSKTFVLGFVGHSGSTAIMSTLAKHPKITVPFPYEPLLPFEGDPAKCARTAEDIFVNHVLRNGEESIIGFKLRQGAIDDEGVLWQSIIDKHETRLILNYRNNAFKTAIGQYSIRKRGDLSSQRGIKTDQSQHCADNPELCSFVIDDLEFFSYMIQKALVAKGAAKYIASRLQWPCVIVFMYEDFMRDPFGEMDRLFRFLGVESMRLESDYNKALSDNPCVVIENYQEVCTALWPCDEFREYLEDPEHNCYCENKPEPPYDATICTSSTDDQQLRRKLCKFITAKGVVRRVGCDAIPNLEEQKKQALAASAKRYRAKMRSKQRGIDTSMTDQQRDLRLELRRRMREERQKMREGSGDYMSAYEVKRSEVNEKDPVTIGQYQGFSYGS